MRITRLRLRDVKRHADLDLEFAPGLTVIRGPNEAGKTTVQRALEMALFRRPTSVSQADPIRPWDRPDAVPTVELSFQADGMSGTLSKSFAGSKGTTRLELDSEVHTDPALVEQRMAELTGLPSEKFFRSTACIRHQELADLDRDEGALRDRLQQSMSGADRGTWAARRKLQEAIARIRTEGSKNPGALKRVREEIARLTEAVDRGQAELAILERDRSALAEARSQRESLDRQLAQAQADLEAAERAVAARDRLAKADAEYARYKRASELRQEVERLEATHPSPMPLADLRAGVERLRSQEYDISERRAELASQPDAGRWQAEEEPLARWRPWALVVILLAVAAVATVVAIPGAIGLSMAGVLAVGVLLAALATARRRRLAVDMRIQNEMRRTQVARRVADRSGLEDQLRRIERDRDDQLAALAMGDLAAAEEELRAETEHASRIDEARAEYRGLLGDAPEEFEDVAQLRDRMAATADEARHALAGMGAVGTEPDLHRQRADAALRTSRTERERAFAEEAAARARVETDTVDAEEVAALSERLDGARDHLDAVERRLRVYETALGALDAAEQATMKKAARYLEQRMGADVAAITDGRYRRVRVDENELRFSVFSVEADDWVDVSQLSRGTLDQIYLAARLGLVRQVTQDRRPPLVFDDPFVTFDDARARRAVGVLKGMARDHQVIYLTTSDRYDSVAERVIELAAPEGRDVAPDPTDTAVAQAGLWADAGAESTDAAPSSASSGKPTDPDRRPPARQVRGGEPARPASVGDQTRPAKVGDAVRTVRPATLWSTDQDERTDRP